MNLTSWLHLLSRRLRWAARFGRRAASATRRSRCAPLSFERLEDRTLLSTFTVTNNNNSGAGSLRQAILDANALGGADDVVFQAGLSGSILITSQISISGSLTISGNGRESTILDAQSGNRIFNISSLADNVTIERMTLQNGSASSDGGAIHSNQNTGDLLKIINSTLTGNKALGAGSDGGAVYVASGAVECAYVTFSNNAAADDGGAIATVSGRITDAFNSTFQSNGAGDDGGAIYTSTGTLDLTGSTITGNIAGAGGGIYAFDSYFVLRSCNVSGNTATAGDGGGLCANNARNCVISQSTLSGNHAGDDGGGLKVATGAVILGESTVSGNVAADDGGGVWGDDALLGFLHVTVTQNTGNEGGGVFILADNFPGEALRIRNSIVAGNTARVASPDFVAPLDPATDLTVASSLIGRRDGTSLSFTGPGAQSSQGNFVGGTSSATAIDPLLGSLQFTGDSAPTHTPLAGSLAIDHAPHIASIDGVLRSTDQRGSPFDGKFGSGADMGSIEVQPLTSLVDGQATIVGTGGSDVILLELDFTTVTVNGTVYSFFLEGVTDLLIDAGSGSDRLVVQGTAGAQSVSLLPGKFILNAGPFTDCNSVETVVFRGNGGADTARFGDSTGKDHFSGRVTQSRMFGPGFDNVAVGVATVIAEATAGGNDSAYLIDTAANNTFTASATTATMSGTGVTANRFESFVGYASSGTDTANLRGTNGKDVLIAGPLRATLAGGSTTLIASAFDRVIANPLGGSDIARLTGRAATVDRLTADPASATLLGSGYIINANAFETLIATANGTGDVATLQDSAGNDRFIGLGNTGTLITPTGSIAAAAFSQITLRGTSGGTNRRTVTPPLTFALIEQGTWV